MGDNTIIKNKAEFETTAQTFFDKIFNQVLENNLGDIDLSALGTGQANYKEFIKKFEKDGLFWVYIAIFMIKNRIIDGLRFPQFECTLTGLNAAALCHGSHGLFNTFDKRAAANGNAFCPPTFTFGIALFQGGLNPFAMG